MDLLKSIFTLHRAQKRIVSLLVDSLFLIFAFWSALFVRLDDTSILANSGYWLVLLFVVPVSLYTFAKFGLYRAVLRYMGLQAVIAIASGIIVSAIALVLVAFYTQANLPRK